jgi:predicted RND superfamily exporter protein
VKLVVRFILRQRAGLAALVLLSLVLAGYSAGNIRLRFQIRDMYDYPGVPGLAAYKQNLRDFGDPAGYVVAMLETKDVFARPVLEYVAKLTLALEPNPLFSHVRSITNVPAIRANGDDITSGPLMAQLPDTAAILADVRKFALHSPLLLRRLISTDASTTAVLAEMRIPASLATFAQQQAALDAAEQTVRRNPPPPGIRVTITGSPAVEAGVTHALMSDQVVLTPLICAALGLVLFLLFRSIHGTLLCMGAVTVALVWTAGVFALFHRPVDIIGSVIPITILSYGVVDPIFVLARFLTKLDAGRSKDDAIVESLSELALPCFLTSLTTALGFGAFAFSRAPTIRYYGGTVAFGVLMGWVTTILVLPIFLAYAPLPKRRFSGIASTRWLDTMLKGFWGFLRPRVGLVIATGCGVLLAGALYGKQQHVSSTYVGSLPRGKTQDDIHLSEKKLAGVVRLTVALKGPTGSMKRPDVLQAIAQIESQIRTNPLVTSVTSLADMVGEANEAFHGGDTQERTVPTSASLIAQYLALSDPSARSDFVSDDYSKACIAVLLVDRGSESVRAISADIRRALVAAKFSRWRLAANLTGFSAIHYGAVDNVVTEVLRGFVTAFCVIVLVQWLFFRSLRLALISVLPNLLPVVACFACLRLLGIPLKIESAIVLCIAIGGLFNTTIHLTARVRQRVRECDESPDAVMEHALRAVGPASFFTAATLSVGFGLLVVSRFPGLQTLGVLSTVTFVVGFFADAVMTSTLLRLAFKWKDARPVSSSVPIEVLDSVSSRRPT